MKFTAVFFVIFLNCVCLLVSYATQDNLKLELLQVLFRHGDRATLEFTIYKNDPYAKISKNIGYGQLTKTGMRRAFKVGRMLRQRYDDFLGEYKYNVYAYSGTSDRTKMSLDLALAGLYPPTSRTAWSNSIHWSPIPMINLPYFLDILSGWETCEEMSSLIVDFFKSPDVEKKVAKYKDFYKYLTTSTGMNVSSPITAFLLWDNLRSALSMGLPLPHWCTEMDYRKLEKNADLLYDALTYPELIRRRIAGQVVEEFVRNFNNSETGDNRMKIYLYAGHDANIASIRKVFNSTNFPIRPDFGSAIIMEKLRDPRNDVYIRTFVWTGVTEKLLPIKLKDCDYECPLPKFLEATKKLLPNKESRNLCKLGESRSC